MSVEARTTIDDDLDRKVRAYTRHHCGTAKSARSDYIKRCIRAQVNRDQGTYDKDKSHPKGSLPFEGEESPTDR